jgi:hypothetical protein
MNIFGKNTLCYEESKYKELTKLAIVGQRPDASFKTEVKTIEKRSSAFQNYSKLQRCLYLCF